MAFVVEAKQDRDAIRKRVSVRKVIIVCLLIYSFSISSLMLASWDGKPPTKTAYSSIGWGKRAQAQYLWNTSNGKPSTTFPMTLFQSANNNYAETSPKQTKPTHPAIPTQTIVFKALLGPKPLICNNSWRVLKCPFLGGWAFFILDGRYLSWVNGNFGGELVTWSMEILGVSWWPGNKCELPQNQHKPSKWMRL